MQAGRGGGMCQCGGACTCGHVGGVAGGAPDGALVNIASCCCVYNNDVWRSGVSTVHAETLSLVACAEVLLASWTCCSCAIKPAFMDAQMSSSTDRTGVSHSSSSTCARTNPYVISLGEV